MSGQTVYVVTSEHGMYSDMDYTIEGVFGYIDDARQWIENQSVKIYHHLYSEETKIEIETTSPKEHKITIKYFDIWSLDKTIQYTKCRMKTNYYSPYMNINGENTSEEFRLIKPSGDDSKTTYTYELPDDISSFDDEFEYELKTYYITTMKLR